MVFLGADRNRQCPAFQVSRNVSYKSTNACIIYGMKKYVKVISCTDERGKVEPRRIIMGCRRWDVKVLDSHPLRDRHGTGTQ